MVCSLKRTFKESDKKINGTAGCGGHQQNTTGQHMQMYQATSNILTGCFMQHWGGSGKTALSGEVQEFVYTMSGPAQSLQDASQCSQFWCKQEQGWPDCL